MARSRSVVVNEPKKVERRIQFYRTDIDRGMIGALIPFRAEDVLSHISALASSGAHQWTDVDGSKYGCWVDQCQSPQRMRFGIYRSAALPHVDRAGVLSPLGESEIVEVVHVVFFQHHIVGSDFNFYGPRLSRLGSYLSGVAREVCPPLAFQALLQHSAIQQLAELKHIRLLRLRIKSSYAEIVTQADEDLGSAFVAARKAGDAQEVEIVLKPQAYAHTWIADKLINPIRALANRKDINDGILRFDVTGLNGNTGRMGMIDALSDLLIAKKKIVLHEAQSGSLDPQSAYTAIEEAYEELEPQLLSAAGVSV